MSPKMNFGLLFQKWSLGTQESFCKVSDQLDTQLNNYGLISWHTSSMNCVNNCTFIFTRHQPRLFLKALLVISKLLYIWWRIFKCREKYKIVDKYIKMCSKLKPCGTNCQRREIYKIVEKNGPPHTLHIRYTLYVWTFYCDIKQEIHDVFSGTKGWEMRDLWEVCVRRWEDGSWRKYLP